MRRRYAGSMSCGSLPAVSGRDLSPTRASSGDQIYMLESAANSNYNALQASFWFRFLRRSGCNCGPTNLWGPTDATVLPRSQPLTCNSVRAVSTRSIQLTWTAVKLKAIVRITISPNSPDHIGVKLGRYENQNHQHKRQYTEIKTQTENRLTILNHQQSTTLECQHGMEAQPEISLEEG